MSDQDTRSFRAPRNDLSPSRSDQDAIADLHAQIAELRAAVEQLQHSHNDLAATRAALQEENLRLRREMTLANLIEGLEGAVEDVGEETGSGTVPPPARRLYDQLPDAFPFSGFFRQAEQEGMDMAQARRALVRYLADGLLVQSGTYLKKGEREG